MTSTPAPSSFVHLHVHTQYSLLQGALQTDTLIDRVKALGMPAVAITDSHNLFGAIDFYLAAKKAGVKPIVGCEIFYAENGRASAAAGGQTQGPRFHHLVLL
jgi:DNA polymerase III subunit alpha